MDEIGCGLICPVADDFFAESYCYFDNRYALAGTNAARVFLVDTAQMRLVEEMAIEGHEPRPVGEYYPTLADQPGLCTDLGWFTRVGDVIVFFYRRDGGAGLKNWKCSLLWYRVAGANSRSTGTSN
jgi:hypothetical protein